MLLHQTNVTMTHKPSRLPQRFFAVMACSALGTSMSYSQLTVGGAPNPNFENLLVWFDANDSSTITTDAGTGNVTGWTSKKPGGLTASRTGTGPEIATVTTLNGSTALDFAGDRANGVFELSEPLIVPDGGSAFVVAWTDDSSGGDTLMTTGANVQFFRQNNNEVRFFRGTSGGDPRIINMQEDLTAERVRYASLSSTEVTYAVNGTDLVVTSADNLGTKFFSLTSLGGRPAAGGCCGDWDGKIAEIIIYDRALTEVEENEIGLYLEEKWGITTEYFDPNGEITSIEFSGDRQYPLTDGIDIVIGSAPIDTIAGTLSAADSADQAQPATFTLVAGDGDDNNVSYSIGGPSLNQLIVSGDVSVPVDTVHSVRVQAMNSASTLEGVVTFTVTADTDNDGLIDDWENDFGTLAQFATGEDADMDNLNDEDEFLNELDPTNDDEDDDGSLDGDEIMNGTDPRDKDSDDDDLEDGAEATAGSNPNVPDSDGDGLNDGQEVNGVPNPNDPNVIFTSNPNEPDTDGDGFNDNVEVQAGFDPDDPNSTPDAGGSIVENGTLNPNFVFLTAWFDASNASSVTTGDGDNIVTTWTDQSINGFVATAGGTGVTRGDYLNGTSTLNFNGSTPLILDRNLVIPVGASGEGSAFVVAKTTDASGGDTLMSLQGANRQFFRQNNAEVRFFKGSAPDAILVDSVTEDRIRFVELGQNVTTYRVNGVDGVINNDGNLGNNDFELNTIGGGGGCCGNWTGDIAEIIIYDRVLTDEEEASVGAYLAAKYGITTEYVDLNTGRPLITAFDRDIVTGDIEITWESRPGQTFKVELSTNLREDIDDVEGIEWAELDEAFPTGGADNSGTTTFTYLGGGPGGLPNSLTEARLFFRVIRN